MRSVPPVRLCQPIRCVIARTVAWPPADVPYPAPPHSRPQRAPAFTAYHPFWEFVPGPPAAEPLPGKEPDPPSGAEAVSPTATDSGRGPALRPGHVFAWVAGFFVYEWLAQPAALGFWSRWADHLWAPVYKIGSPPPHFELAFRATTAAGCFV